MLLWKGEGTVTSTVSDCALVRRNLWKVYLRKCKNFNFNQLKLAHNTNFYFSNIAACYFVTPVHIQLALKSFKSAVNVENHRSRQFDALSNFGFVIRNVKRLWSAGFISATQSVTMAFARLVQRQSKHLAIVVVKPKKLNVFKELGVARRSAQRSSLVTYTRVKRNATKVTVVNVHTASPRLAFVESRTTSLKIVRISSLNLAVTLAWSHLNAAMTVIDACFVVILWIELVEIAQ